MIVNALKQLLLTEETSVTDILAIQHIPSLNLRYLMGITVPIIKICRSFSLQLQCDRPSNKTGGRTLAHAKNTSSVYQNTVKS